jgi:DNA-binding MarR family transcriptional regulator
MRPEAAVWLRLARVYHRLAHAAAARLRAQGLSPAQFDVLAQVGAAEGDTQQALAARLLTTKGNICQLLDRMEGMGLVQRIADGRTNRLYLTPAGRRLWREVVPAHEAWVASQIALLPPPERQSLAAGLRRLDRALRRGPSATP